ncbi:NifU family protein [Candidatus Deianiraea vastatrix]|uniref:Iron-sulfur cluster assembly NifU/NfuA-like protein n=1 Tax=Candidatus Deianiraea vastatrix TaxID=2163644 RepID=A0A5B8XHH1_9RICK|nr:NifU family protein [Candidatus Deianiraea vastatrix]QED23541.1 iron-sulfur cluster assembly NifU/NfuA-like protein [Candidatus Deianiraea vastatrix]
MFVQTQETPNSNALKFIPGNIPIAKDKTYDFPDIEYAKKVSRLAEKLFEINDVKRVFFGSNFITVTKDENADWMAIKPHVFATIVEYMTNGWAIFLDDESKIDAEFASINSKKEIDSRLKEILDKSVDMENKVVKEIIALIDERVKPAVAMDGGDINFINFVDGIVYVEMLGACSGCSSSGATLKGGIETMLKHYIPEVESVEAI